MALLLLGCVLAVLAMVGASEWKAPRTSPPPPLLPQTFFTDQVQVRVVPVASGLSHPWSLAFLPDGRLLVTERSGRLRIIHNGIVDPTPVPGSPVVFTDGTGGLFELMLHPKFAQNGWVYFSYAKSGDGNRSATALARGHFDGSAVTDLKDIFVANNWSTSSALYGGRMVFDRDGFLFLSVGDRQEKERAQNGNDDGGKILRLRDDGSVPRDNPFVGREGYQPEIYSLGHRNPEGLAIHPETGELWEDEHGPMGGDEINIIKAGRNYGWPLVTFGTDYDGSPISNATWRADLEAPFLYWVPSIAPSGLTFYTGDQFERWKGNIFVGAMMEGRTRGTGHVQRIVINAAGHPINREPFLTELHQRIRDVRQGPDGYLYLLTDEAQGLVLRLEPAL